MGRGRPDRLRVETVLPPDPEEWKRQGAQLGQRILSRKLGEELEPERRREMEKALKKCKRAAV